MMGKNGNIPIPCMKDGRDCPRRRPGCQSGCPDYEEFARRIAERNEVERQLKKEEGESTLWQTII